MRWERGPRSSNIEERRTGGLAVCAQVWSAAVGPFYCPGDSKVYIDLAFFADLRDRFNAPGDFAKACVIAHEVGHHVQNLLGTSAKVQRAREGQDDAGCAVGPARAAVTRLCQSGFVYARQRGTAGTLVQQRLCKRTARQLRYVLGGFAVRSEFPDEHHSKKTKRRYHHDRCQDHRTDEHFKKEL